MPGHAASPHDTATPAAVLDRRGEVNALDNHNARRRVVRMLGSQAPERRKCAERGAPAFISSIGAQHQLPLTYPNLFLYARFSFALRTPLTALVRSDWSLVPKKDVMLSTLVEAKPLSRSTSAPGCAAKSSDICRVLRRTSGGVRGLLSTDHSRTVSTGSSCERRGG